ncbi:transporter [Methylogaea oryzae]|uniref:Transporter n=2 Tax=Methylogaea oryzae TaxID=1295382 RepID=A0A8D5AIE3_9GAMM|nr:transporter [Methylogaea oryzae]
MNFAIPALLLWLAAAAPAWAELPTGPLNLEQILDLAFERNPDLSAAAERIGQAEAKVGEAAAAFYPKLTGRVGYTYSDDPTQAFSAIVSQRRFTNRDFQNINQPGYVENFRPEVVGAWSLFRGGSDYFRKKAAELGVEAAELERSALRNGLAASVTSAYYAVLAAPQQLEVARRSIEAVDSALRHAQAQHREGALLKSDVLSLEVRRAQAGEAEVRAINGVELTRSGLKTLLGLGAADPLEVRAGADSTAAPISDKIGELITQALAQRPEMQAAAHQVQIREKELLAEQGGHLPRVNAYAAYGMNTRTPDFNANRDNVTLGLNAEVDLFAGGATAARVSGAERKVAEAQAIQQRTRLEIEDEVQRAHANLKEARQRLVMAEAADRAAEEAMRLVYQQYQAGTANVTRYLEAEADRAQAQTRAVMARYDAQVAQANLQKALGFWK